MHILVSNLLYHTLPLSSPIHLSICVIPPGYSTLGHILRAKVCTPFQIDILGSSSPAPSAHSSRLAPRSCRRPFHHLPAECTPGNGCSLCQADQLTCKVGLHAFLSDFLPDFINICSEFLSGSDKLSACDASYCEILLNLYTSTTQTVPIRFACGIRCAHPKDTTVSVSQENLSDPSGEWRTTSVQLARTSTSDSSWLILLHLYTRL